MPTAFAHALVGGSLATLTSRSIPPIRFGLVAAFLAVFPDIDVLGFRYGIPYSDMLGHRGLSHSIPFAAIISIIVALSVFAQVPRFTKSFWWLTFLLFLATASHGILDTFTDAGLGVGLLMPFDDTRYFAPWRPLTTSPLSIARFFNDSAPAILMNELKWVGIPVIVFVVGTVFGRRVFSKADA